MQESQERLQAQGAQQQPWQPVAIAPARQPSVQRSLLQYLKQQQQQQEQQVGASGAHVHHPHDQHVSAGLLLQQLQQVCRLPLDICGPWASCVRGMCSLHIVMKFGKVKFSYGMAT